MVEAEFMAPATPTASGVQYDFGGAGPVLVTQHKL